MNKNAFCWNEYEKHNAGYVNKKKSFLEALEQIL